MRSLRNFFITTLLLMNVFVTGLFLTQTASAEAVASSKIAGGTHHSVDLKDDGTVWTWGYNSSGQLGDGTKISQAIRGQVKNLTDVKAISAGATHSIALKNDGTVTAWGSNSSGKLGDGTTTMRLTPVQVKDLTNVAVIASGPNHTLALKNDGTVWAWGQNSYGKLGDGTVTYRKIPVRVPGLTNVVAIAAGTSHSLALKSDGTIWTWGYNYNGQLGNGDTVNQLIPTKVKNMSGVKAITAGASHSVALKNDGTVWSWGSNSSGKLGDGTTTNSVTAVKVSGLTNIVSISAGLNHTLALKSDGAIWAWGQNSSGKLGDGTTTYRKVPVNVTNLSDVASIAGGANHSLAIKSDGTIWTWGQNSYGKLGNGTTTLSKVPVQVKGLLNNQPNPVIEEDTNPVIIDDTAPVDEPTDEETDEPIDEPSEEPTDEPVDDTTPPDEVPAPTDITAPTTTSNVTEGWSNQDVAIQLIATDDLSGVDKTFYSINSGSNIEGTSLIVNQEGTQQISFYSIDKAGNMEQIKMIEVNIDKTAPVTTSNVALGWANQEVQVQLTAADLLSGIDKTYYSIDGASFIEGTSFNIQTEGSHQIAFYSLDKSGNVEETKTVQVNVDGTAPVTTATYPDGWSKQDIQVQLTAVDNLSGNGQTFYSVNGAPFVLGTSFTISQEGAHQVSFYSVDKAGNQEIAKTVEVKVDKTAPSTTSNVTGEWSTQDVHVQLAAVDNFSQVGKTFYSINGSANAEGTSFMVSGEGIHHVSFYSVDQAGNEEEAKTFEVKIDTTAPVSSSDALDAWSKGDVTVHLTAADNLSGVSNTYYSIDDADQVEGTTLTLIKEGIHKVNFYSVDRASNIEMVKSKEVKLDKTAPMISMDLANEYALGSQITLNYKASDALSGVAQESATINGQTYKNGEAIRLDQPGTYKVVVTTTDKAGWTTTVEKTFMVYISGTLVVNPGVIKANDGGFTVKVTVPKGYSTEQFDLNTATLNMVAAKKDTNGLVQQAKNGQFKFNREDFNWTPGNVNVEFHVMLNGYLVIGRTTIQVK